MTQKVQLKRSAIAGKVPLIADLSLGEIAINTYDGKLFFKKDNGTTQSIIELLSTGTAATVYEPSITSGTSSQYWRGDKTWQTLNKTAVGLGNVENTALTTWTGSTNISTIGDTTATSLTINKTASSSITDYCAEFQLSGFTTNAGRLLISQNSTYALAIAANNTSGTSGFIDFQFINRSTGVVSSTPLKLKHDGTIVTSLDASGISSGTVSPARLGTGIANNTTFLRGDGSWAIVSGSGATLADDNSTNATYYPAFASATSGIMSTATVSSTKLTFNPSTSNLSIGGNTPSAKLHIFDESNAGFSLNEYGTVDGAVLRGYRARGTITAPSAVLANDTLFGFRGFGYTSSAAYSLGSGSIDIIAAENFTSTAQGSYISLLTTATGTTSRVEKFRIGPAGQLGIGGATYGTAGQVLVSGGASAAPSWSTNISGTAAGNLPLTGGTLTGGLTISNNSLRVSGWGAAPNDGVVYFGSGDNYIYKNGTGFTLNIAGSFSATLNIGGTILTSSNYNSYSPSLTGTGASGTWSINITGNSNYANSAGSATSATTASNLAAGGSAGQVLTSNGGSAPSWQAVPASGLGVGQTYQDVLASRALSTTYTNSTGKPIEIIVVGGGGSYMTLYINGSQLTANLSEVSGIVPTGATYMVTYDGTLYRWTELR